MKILGKILGAVVVIVAVAELPGVIELGLTEHWGACAGDGCGLGNSRGRRREGR